MDRDRAAHERANLVVDGLTGAYQRAPGLMELEREITKARRTGQPFVLAFFDAVGLKAVNDTQGHAAGDKLLQRLVEGVKSAVREYDPVIRYGGDEFICGILGLSLGEVEIRFADVEEEHDSRGVSFTVGLALLGSEDSLEDLIARADATMYAQRRGGRDRTVRLAAG